MGGTYRSKTSNAPLVWQRHAVKAGLCYRMFTCSLSDFFHAKADDWRPAAWDTIRHCRNFVWLILTKRPERILRHLPADWPAAYPNVWLGVSSGCRDDPEQNGLLRKVPIHPNAVRSLRTPVGEHRRRHRSVRLWMGNHRRRVRGRPGIPLWNPTADWRKEFHTKGRRIMLPEWANNFG